MVENIDDFSVCSDNWEQIEQVTNLRNQLENIRLWFHADKDPNEDVLAAVDRVIGSTEHLYRRLIDLQIKLISAL